MATSDIMVVDDNPANLKLLEDMLLQQGHEVRSFPLGRLALAAAMKNQPDLILLDINMPEMSGYQVCERLKSTPELADIPVIFLSALNDTQDKVKAFQSGAVDYISKPFHFEEVHARVETHLKIHDLQRALKSQNERLESAVAARTRELGEAHQRLTILDRSKGEFLSLISHELRTPLNGLLGVAEIILDEMPGSEENKALQELFRRSRERIVSMLDDALLLTQIDLDGQQFKPVPICLHGVLSQATEKASELARSRRVAFALPPPGAALVRGNEELMKRALQALLETASKFSSEGGLVRVTQAAAADWLKVTIESHGHSIPPSILPKFFDLFSVREDSTAGRDLGLGPAVASRTLALFDASVGVANCDPAGVRLTITLRSA